MLSCDLSSNLLLCEACVWRRGLLGSCARDVSAILEDEVVVGQRATEDRGSISLVVADVNRSVVVDSSSILQRSEGPIADCSFVKSPREPKASDDVQLGGITEAHYAVVLELLRVDLSYLWLGCLHILLVELDVALARIC